MAAHQRWRYDNGHIRSLLNESYIIEIKDGKSHLGQPVCLNEQHGHGEAAQLWDFDGEGTYRPPLVPQLNGVG